MHAEAWEFLLALEPDVALLQETVLPPSIDRRYETRFTQAWDGKPWGSAILARNCELSTVWKDNTRGAVHLATCTGSPLGVLSIATIHARIIHGRVIPALTATFEDLVPQLDKRFLVGGDLNTARAAHLAWPKYGHGEFWDRIDRWQLHECFHLNTGLERQSYWREWHRNKTPSIGNTLQDDHVFVDEETSRLVRRTVIWDTRRVRELSDHGPLVVDLNA